MMRYKGYTATVEYDPSINMLHGTVDNIQGVISFVASSTEDLRQEFEKSVDDYLAFCEEQGVEPERPYSGYFALRIEPGVHRAVVLEAKRRGESMNAWIAHAIMKELGWANCGLRTASPSGPDLNVEVLRKILQDFVKQFGSVETDPWAEVRRAVDPVRGGQR